MSKLTCRFRGGFCPCSCGFAVLTLCLSWRCRQKLGSDCSGILPACSVSACRERFAVSIGECSGQEGAEEQIAQGIVLSLCCPQMGLWGDDDDDDDNKDNSDGADVDNMNECFWSSKNFPFLFLFTQQKKTRG